MDFPEFRWFLFSRMLWALASQMIAVAVGYQVYIISRDPLDLGLVGLAQFVPFIVLAIPSGHLADLVNRRALLVGCYFLLSLCAVALAIIAASDPQSSGQIIAIMAVYGGTRALTLPAGNAIVPNLVPGEAFPNAVALSSTSFQLATIAGPALGGFLLVSGPAVVYVVASGLLVLATVMLTRIGATGIASRRHQAFSISGLFTGLRFVWSEKVIFGSISLDMMAVLVGSVVALLPIYATDILDVGPGGLGLMRAAPAVGAMGSALVLSMRPLQSRVGLWLIMSVVVYGGLTIAFANSRSISFSLILLIGLGTADMVSVYIRQLLVQLKSPDSIRGRVSAANSVFVGASNELGEFESGLTAAWWGPVVAAGVGGFLTIGLALVWAVLFPDLRRLNQLPKPANG